MPKIKVGDHLIFRQLDISDMGIRYCAVALIVKTVRKEGAINVRLQHSWVKHPHPPLCLNSWMNHKMIGSMHQTTYPDRLCVWCITPPSKDISGIKKLMAGELHHALTKQIDIIRRKIDVAVSWGSSVNIPSAELAEMESIIEEHHI